MTLTFGDRSRPGEQVIDQEVVRLKEEVEKWKTTAELHKENYDILLGDSRMKLVAAQAEIIKLQAEVSEQCRLNGAGSEREAALLGKVERLEKQCATLLLALEAYPEKGEFFMENLEATILRNETLTSVKSGVSQEDKYDIGEAL